MNIDTLFITITTLGVILLMQSIMKIFFLYNYLDKRIKREWAKAMLTFVSGITLLVGSLIIVLEL